LPASSSSNQQVAEQRVRIFPRSVINQVAST
jgi:hypothetical protein